MLLGSVSPVRTSDRQAKRYLGESADTLLATAVAMWTLVCSVLMIYDLHLLGMVLWQTVAAAVL